MVVMVGCPLNTGSGWMEWLQLMLGHAGRSLGRLAVLRARLGIHRQSNLNMFTLIAIGTGAAYRLQRDRHSVSGRNSRTLSATADGVEVYFEAAAVIITLVLLGQVLELRARRRTSGAIRAYLACTSRPLASCVETVRRKKSPR